MTSQPPEAPPPLSAAEHKRLDRSFIKGVAWTGASKYSIQIFTWVATVVSARLLTPDDYGLMAMASVYFGLILLVSEFGLSSAIVTLRNLSESQVAQINTLSVLLGLAGFLVSCLVAGSLGRFFDAPALPGVLTVMGFGFVITSFQIVPSALLQKEYRFKAISIIGAIRAIAQSSAVVVFAWMGFRYWSLVLAALLGSSLSTGLILLVRRHRLAIPCFPSLSPILNFSGRMLMTRFSWYAYHNADFVIAGRVLGQSALGSYRVAWDLAGAPLEKVTGLICSVTPAFYSAVKQDLNTLRRYMLRPAELIALVIFPAMLGTSLVARDLVLVLLGNKWEASIPVLQLLSFFACARSIVPLFEQVLIAVREENFVMWNAFITMIVLSISFLIGSQWGLVGIASAWVIAYPVSAVPLYRKVCRKIGLTHTEFFHTLLPAITGSVIMSLALVGVKAILNGHLGPVIGRIVQAGHWELPYFLKIAAMLQWLLDGHFGNIVRLVVQVACGAVVYVLALLFFHRERLLALRGGFAMMMRQ